MVKGRRIVRHAFRPRLCEQMNAISARQDRLLHMKAVYEKLLTRQYKSISTLCDQAIRADAELGQQVVDLVTDVLRENL